MEFIVRKGEERDLPAVLELIKEHAVYEKSPDAVATTVEKMRTEGFSDNPYYGIEVAEKDGGIIGIALYYYSYSSWKGKKFFLEDLMVTEAERGRRVGKALFDRCLELAKEQGFNYMVWQVSEWNEPSINFYKKYGTEFSTEWMDCSLEVK